MHQPLPEQLKAGIEQLSGISMDHVKVHYNAAGRGGVSAHAFARGTDIYLAPGQEHHLPQEAWHVAQQRQARIRPDAPLPGDALQMGQIALLIPEPRIKRNLL